MKLQHIYIENYKTYRQLDLNLEVQEDRPIILIGGANGCGKTTLFDAIYGALYGLDIKDKRQFEELLNAEVKNEAGIEQHGIILEITFSGVVLGVETPYKLKRTYRIIEGEVRESVELNMNGNRFVYGSATPAAQRASNEETVNKIIAANLPRELSNYFLFDAMKTSDLVKEEQINKLILKNINSVMGFNKYAQLREVSEALLVEKKTARLENEKQRAEYENLQRTKSEKEQYLIRLKEDYTNTLRFADDNKDAYERVKAGRSADDVTRDKIAHIEQSIKDFAKKEATYRQEADNLGRELETNVFYPKLADIIRSEVEVILQEKERINAEEATKLTGEQIENVTHNIVQFISEHYLTMQKIDETEVAKFLRIHLQKGNHAMDKYPYFSNEDIEVLSSLIQSAYVNPYIALNESRSALNMEIASLPQRKKQLEDYQLALRGTDYSLMELYENNEKRISELKGLIFETEKEIDALSKQIASYDYDMPQVPDPQFDMLCKLPDFFKILSRKLLKAKKENIERMMRDQLNLNLVIYAGYIGRVELSGSNADDISFKMYHKNGNEIYLSQLNAGAKQTVMQVLLKVLYELGDYDPPVMIDTVMGVLDKQSREVILEKYFPDLAHQTILLSTDTEITTERDFKKIEAFVAKAYTLHRDQDKQCTVIENNYFGLTPSK